jgi:hypothetical protein
MREAPAVLHLRRFALFVAAISVATAGCGGPSWPSLAPRTAAPSETFNFVGTWHLSFQWTGLNPGELTLVVADDGTCRQLAERGVSAAAGTYSVKGDEVRWVLDDGTTWTGTATSDANIAGTMSDSSGKTGVFAVASPAESPEPTLPPMSGTPILFLATATSGSYYDHDLGVSIKSGGQTIIRYLPDVGYADIVATNSTYEFASSYIYPYVVDERLFIRDERDAYSETGTATVTEFDPTMTGPMAIAATPIAGSIQSFRVDRPNTVTTGCTAIVGSTYYYVVYPTQNALDGNRGGEFRKLEMSDGDGLGSELIERDDANNCWNHLGSSDGLLLDAAYYQAQDGGQYIEAAERDLDTGRPIRAQIRAWAVADPDEWKDDSFGFDGSTIYWARINKADGRLQVQANDLGSRSYDWTEVWNAPVSGLTGINYFAVNNGWVAAAVQQGGIVFYLDAATGKGRSFHLDMQIYSVQILFLRS